MASKKKKPARVDWLTILLSALADLVIGTLLIIIGKLKALITLLKNGVFTSFASAFTRFGQLLDNQ